ncbi:flagellar brake protein [Mesobacillus zeae]|uniref:Pilus assembly protein PilZ n=1 Tax=Mesobacillus zeae TaxID=1917180 RepID=A0A398BBV3_9BACI|nr:flagellar brake domain-containing protein [Mesobacillus zeae]RID87312.1 pilus assembly protein PilZ [Mesobacillus zeae]
MLKIGDVIILEHFYADSYGSYKCKLVEKRGSDLYIDYPLNIETGKNVYLLEGTLLKAVFTGEGGSRFQFSTEVKGRAKESIPMLVLAGPALDSLVKVQRRQYVRVETPIDVAVLSVESGKPLFTAVTEDFSAGGAALLAASKESLHAGMELECLLVFPMQGGEYKYKKVKSRVIRIQEAMPGINKISIQFIGTNGIDRQLFLRFCFDRQLDQKKKGLLIHG